MRNFEFSHFFEDVYTFNDFVHNGVTEPLKKPKEVVKGRVPYLVTEHNGHMYPTKKFDCEEKRVEQASAAHARAGPHVCHARNRGLGRLVHERL